MICDPRYTRYHFEVYVPNTCPRWSYPDSDTGCRFHIDVKTASGHTFIQFSETFSSQTAVAVPIVLDSWTSIDMDISSFTSVTQLQRYSIYMSYGTMDRPTEIFIRNAYVAEE